MVKKVGKSNRNPEKLKWLLSHWAILSGICLGIVIGLTAKKTALLLAPFGKIYLSLLQMCIIPILITAVISALGHLISEGKTNQYILRLVIVFFITLICASSSGLLTGILFKPGKNLDSESKIVLGKVLAKSKQSETVLLYESPNLFNFLIEIVPTNLFDAMVKDQNLAILFFSIIFGIALGFVNSSSSQLALSVFEGLYDSFLKIIEWIMYGLPIGLLCLFASQVAQVGLQIMWALAKLVLLIYLCSLFLLFLFQIIIWRSVKGSFLQSLSGLKETIVVAFGTSSSFATIPSALRGLTEELKINKEFANLIIPLGISINPPGNVLYFAISTVFIAQIYNVVLNWQGILILILGAVFAGMAATGAPGMASLSMMSLILEPLNLPVQSTIILLMAIDPILDPILTVVNVHSNCTVTTLIAEKQDKVGIYKD